MFHIKPFFVSKRFHDSFVTIDYTHHLTWEPEVKQNKNQFNKIHTFFKKYVNVETFVSI